MIPRFCTQCAGPLEWRRLEDERLPQPVCTRCGHVEWQNPKPTASALITRRRNDGAIEVLLVRRAKEPFRNAWDCPGGFVDPDEHPEQSVLREMREELGLEVDVQRFVGIFMDRYGDDGESVKRKVTVPVGTSGMGRPRQIVSGTCRSDRSGRSPEDSCATSPQECVRLPTNGWSDVRRSSAEPIGSCKILCRRCRRVIGTCGD